MHSNQQQQYTAMAMPHAVRRVQVLFAACVQVQGLPCTAAALSTQHGLLRHHSGRTAMTRYTNFSVPATQSMAAKARTHRVCAR